MIGPRYVAKPHDFNTGLDDAYGVFDMDNMSYGAPTAVCICWERDDADKITDALNTLELSK